METPRLKFNFALLAEQVVSPSESDRPRPPQLLDAPAYWEAIAAVLPQAEAMVRDAPVAARETAVTTREVANEAARRALTGLKLGDQCKQTDTRHVWLVVDAANVANAAGWVDVGAYTVPAGGKGQ